MKRLSLALTFFFTSSGVNSWAQFASESQGSVVTQAVQAAPESIADLSALQLNHAAVGGFNRSLPTYKVGVEQIRPLEPGLTTRRTATPALSPNGTGVSPLSNHQAVRMLATHGVTAIRAFPIKDQKAQIAPASGYTTGQRELIKRYLGVNNIIGRIGKEMAFDLPSNLPLATAREDARTRFEGQPAASLSDLDDDSGPANLAARYGFKAADALDASEPGVNAPRPFPTSVSHWAPKVQEAKTATGGGGTGSIGPANPSAPAGGSDGNNNTNKPDRKKWLTKYEILRAVGASILAAGVTLLVFGPSFGITPTFKLIAGLAGLGAVSLTHGILGEINETLSRNSLGTAPAEDTVAWKSRVGNWQSANSDRLFLRNKDLMPEYEINPNIGVGNSIKKTIRSIGEFLSLLIRGQLFGRDGRTLYSLLAQPSRFSGFGDNLRDFFKIKKEKIAPITGQGSLTDGAALNPSGDGYLLKQEVRGGVSRNEQSNLLTSGLALVSLAVALVVPGYFKLIPMMLSLGIIGSKVGTPLLEYLGGLRKAKPAASTLAKDDYILSALLSSADDAAESPSAKTGAPSIFSTRIDWRKVQVVGLAFGTIFLGIFAYLHMPHTKAPTPITQTYNITFTAPSDLPAVLDSIAAHGGGGTNGGKFVKDAPVEQKKGKLPKMTKDGAGIVAPMKHPKLPKPQELQGDPRNVPDPVDLKDAGLTDGTNLLTAITNNPNTNGSPYGANGNGLGLGSGGGSGAGPGNGGNIGGGNNNGGAGKDAVTWLGPKPIYPKEAMRNKVQAKFIFKFYINGQGLLLDPATNAPVNMSVTSEADFISKIEMVGLPNPDPFHFTQSAVDAYYAGFKQCFEKKQSCFQMPENFKKAGRIHEAEKIQIGYDAH